MMHKKHITPNHSTIMMQDMEHDHQIFEVLGITKFMIFLSQRLSDREYQRVCDLQTEYLDIQLEQHLEHVGMLSK